MLETSPFIVLRNEPRNGQSFEEWLVVAVKRAGEQSEALQKLLENEMIPKSLAVAAEQHRLTLLAVQSVL